MKNILVSSSSEPDGGSGISTYTRELATCLVKKGFTVHYLSPPPTTTEWIDKYKIVHIPSPRDSLQSDTCRKVYNHIVNNNIDAIINNDNSVITSISPALACPIISVGHMEKRTIAKLASTNVEWMDYIVAISNDMKQTYTTRYRVPISKCPVIHNGLNFITDEISNISNSKLQIIFAGQYSKIKGADLIVKMIKTRHSVWNNIELNWYGEIPDKIRRSISGNKNVKAHGRVDRSVLMNKLKTADIFLMASRLEGCPMAMLEAMSHGVVPITSNGHGAMQWLIDHGIHGYVCDLKHWPDQALSCVDALNNNRDRLKEMKISVLNHFNKEHLTDKTVDKLLNLLNNPTVDRESPKKEITVIKWHRTINSSFIDKVCWRLGILRKEASIKL